MDKDLYIEFLENEIRRIRAGANTHYGQSIGWMDELQDLKLENDRLKKRDEIMVHFLRSIRCQGMLCGKCDLLSDYGCYWLDNPSCKDMWNMIDDVFKKLEEL